MFAVLVSIGNPEGLLMPGMNAEVDVRIARSENVMTVPVMALRTERDLESTASILGVDEADIHDALKVATQDTAAPRGERGGDYRFGGKFWVVVDTDGAFEFRNVVTGITDLDRVEIAEGLGDGDSVLILPSTHLVETQQELQKWITRRVGGVPGIQ